MQAIEFSFQMESVIRGHHVSKTVWTPFVGEVLSLSPESGNEHDRFAVSGGVGAKLNRCLFSHRSTKHAPSISCCTIAMWLRSKVKYRLINKEVLRTTTEHALQFE